MDKIARREKQMQSCLPWLFKDGPWAILYIGANAEMHTALGLLQQAGHEVKVLEAWPANAEWVQQSGLADTVVLGDLRELDSLPLGDNYDVIIWFHGPEHVEEEEFIPILNTLEQRGTVVVLGAPWGKTPQQPGVQPFERHLSGHWPEDWKQLGYATDTLPPENVPGGNLMGWKWT